MRTKSSVFVRNQNPKEKSYVVVGVEEVEGRLSSPFILQRLFAQTSLVQDFVNQILFFCSSLGNIGHFHGYAARLEHKTKL